ncbi:MULTISPECIES: RNA-binding cell elongation regulator Jag/EloR [unclassified Paenibacillus]|uniref:RNA-binding cell elongation regulator Jag/EloR n=1 Tax=unclassified Paenibacillus TaxID=185978 RepID=UPI001C114C97|nr:MULTISPECIES: RNA-binding cell elongation regulator Jag/EloR [unclassified Paenibacillus]MBU5441961.1 protein jag [Paenibacillus sp. MSJ-34]CAH0121876.1 hypothetical protein PAE9249_04411 [Paenibacillus sp. CECT 9249]
MRKVVVSGKSIEDAVRNGLAQLNTTRDRVTVEVLEQPSKGLFGLIGSREAKVEVALLPDPEPIPEPAPEDSSAAERRPVDEAIRFVKEVAQSMKVDIAIEEQTEKEGTILNISGSNLGLLIGRRGQTLDSLQYLTNIVANRYSKNHLRIILDAEQFRARRRKTLESLSDRLAGQVIKNRKDVVLEPMSPQERKIIHSKLQDHPKVKTYSVGEEPNRKVVITLK